MLKVSSCLTHPPQNHGPLNFLRNLTDNHILMAHFSKLRKYQTFVLIELHNMSKGQLADRIFKIIKKLCLRLPGRRTYIFCNSDILIFPTFKQLLSTFLRENFQVSK